MLSAKDEGKIYETILSSPGMNDTVKINLRITRKTVLLLSKIIELGMNVKDENVQGSLLQAVNGETMDEVKNFSGLLLDKAGLKDMYEKINSFSK